MKMLREKNDDNLVYLCSRYLSRFNDESNL